MATLEIEYMDGKHEIYRLGPGQEWESWRVHRGHWDVPVIVLTRSDRSRKEIPLCNVRTYGVAPREPLPETLVNRFLRRHPQSSRYETYVIARQAADADPANAELAAKYHSAKTELFDAIYGRKA